ncbi:MAG: type II toxin-antitoxin system RelE/ParE family toxin [Prevotellaceae bacterium]|jgi:plasmid stabilization system protein ParE|nr:type II toxin-antitoxin system RelE/ParE family toxin [Prevotellaceae bacterium]
MFSIKWETAAIEEQISIFEFWNNLNKSKEYSRKLFKEIKRLEGLLSKNPSIGTLTDFSNIRKIVVFSNFSIFYKVVDKTIYIVKIWDNHRNPDNLIF